MTREEAIQALNEIFDDSEFSRYESWYGTAMDMAIEALQAEPKHGEWVPVSERLPSEIGWYLITVQDVNCFTDMDYYYGNSKWDEISSKQKVIAWMSLPKPYREDGE